MPEKFNPDLFRFILIKNEEQNFTFLYERFQLPQVTGDWILHHCSWGAMFIDFMGNLTQEFTTAKTYNKFHYNATSQLTPPWNYIPTNQQNFDNKQSLATTDKHDFPIYKGSFGFFHLTARGTFLIIHCLSAYLPVCRVFQLK